MMSFGVICTPLVAVDGKSWDFCSSKWKAEVSLNFQVTSFLLLRNCVKMSVESSQTAPAASATPLSISMFSMCHIKLIIT